jgi:hypothetical protein
MMQRMAQDEAATNLISKLPEALQDYARQYWIHLSEGTRQPDPSAFGLTYDEAQQVRITLAGLA